MHATSRPPSGRPGARYRQGVGGTVTGEHGVGILKHDGMLKELHPEALRMQRAVKAALDPLGLFNPGKAV